MDFGKTWVFCAALAALPGGFAAEASKEKSPYAGQVTRPIKSLSEQDVAELRRGGGWGLAKAAELNGIPGPVHLLELQNEIPLTTAQVHQLEAIYAGMKEEAIVAGERFIEAEWVLERAFASGSIDSESLREMIADAAAARGDLRYIHLSRHLATLEILSPEQITRYGTLRGYDASPCEQVPAGHDAEHWRRHNGCDSPVMLD